jgi:hypothetical protein
MNKSPYTAFFLAFLPGLGHLYLGKIVRGVLYLMSFILVLVGGIFLAFLDSYDAEIYLLGSFFICLIIWVINMTDMVIHLLRRQQRVGEAGAAAAGSDDRESADPTRSESDRFYTLLLSMIPGLGHFHMGLMNRGVAFLIAFFGLGTMIVFISIVTDQGGFLAFIGILPIVWIYSMFDAIQLLNRKQKGESVLDRTFLEDFTHDRADKKSKALAVILSVFPGAGHMYLGMQRRGLQLMAGFLLAIYILDVLRLAIFLFLIPIIWFFSFFDAMQQASKIGEEPLKDVPLISYFINHQRWFGIGLLLLGAYYLFDHVMVPTLLPRLSKWFNTNLTYYYREYFQTTVLCVVLIGGGIRLLMGSKKRDDEVSGS